MTPQSQTHSNRRRQPLAICTARRAFTLIELMVVIVIIAVLVGILTPAVMSAMRKARIAEVTTEISQLNGAMGSFRAEFGSEPPSQVTLHVDQAGWDGDSRSKAIVRRLWPQFDFSGTGGGGWTSSQTLNGAECLVFFLGGVIDGNGALVGFSKNPTTPFATGGSRVGPFFSFDSSRVSDTESDDVPEYLDPLPSQSTPYVYLSSYDGRGYRSSEVTTLAGSSNFSTLTSWYTLPGGTSPYKPKSFQIISPGSDGAIGTGGVYDGENYTIANDADKDNITNFSGGQLVP